MDILRRVQAGEPVGDHEFDRIYPPGLRRWSRIHWTPVETARKAAAHLVQRPGSRILDVGSGAGKFCFIGAAVTPGRFVGVEKRAALVQAARNLARQWNWPGVEFSAGDAFAWDWSPFDGVYLFNPFAEHLFKSIRMDDEMEAGLDAFDRAVERTQAKLKELRVGARVAMLNGFGGVMPESFRLEREEACGNAKLEIWVRSPT